MFKDAAESESTSKSDKFHHFSPNPKSIEFKNSFMLKVDLKKL